MQTTPKPSNIVPLPKSKAKSLWVKSRVSNLVSYQPSGTYFLRAKVGGKVIRESLKTKVESIAARKVVEILKAYRQMSARQVWGKQTMGDAAKAYLDEKRQTVKPRSLEYREDTWGMIKRLWPGISDLLASRVTREDCEAWAQKARAKYSATRFNGCVETLRGVLGQAVKDGSRLDNPAMEIERSPVPLSELQMPSNEQFQAILKAMDGHPARRLAALTVRILAFTGLRINEARHLERKDVDLKAGRLLARVTKNSEPRTIPIIKDAIRPLKDFLAGHNIVNPARALKTVSTAIGLPLTPHDLRHLFATRCVEAGIDFRTIAAWLGHKDGGALLLKRYAHLRDEHSKRMAKKVRF